MNRLKIYRRCLIAALLLAVMTLGIYGFYYMSNQVPDEIRISEEETQTLDLGLKEVSVRVVKREKVIPGGIPVGIYLETQGVYVVGTDAVQTADGMLCEPAGQAVQSGDYILAVNGRRITDAQMLEVVTMVYGGLVNKNLVAKLQAKGVNALGLTGADMDVIHSHKRPVKDGVDFGYVGDVERANGKMLQTLIQEGITPVMAPLTHDGNGNILNTNADTIASETAKALAPYYDVTLIYSFEKKGVLSNPDDDNSVIPVITRSDFEKYQADGTIGGGMIPKIENALAAVDAGVKEVIITLATAIDGKQGTVIK